MEIPGWTHLLEDHLEHPVAMDQAISWIGVELWKKSSERRSGRWLRKTEGIRVFGHFDGLDDIYAKYHNCCNTLYYFYYFIVKTPNPKIAQEEEEKVLT